MTNMPDFDSMSPEELMKWMESLAKRQGAYEGFTTDADMEIDEIDPDTVVIDEPGYIPYGQENKPAEAAPARPAAASTPPPAPVQPPAAQPAPPPPAPAAQPAASAASDTPDFDSMSPEEMMKWMESLAKRQGAYEGFTTDADMNVPEIDPSTVDESKLGPGYVPYGQEDKAKQAAPAPKPAAAPAQPPAQPPAAQTAPPPPPAPVQQPAASAQPATVDVDNMSPEELMRWMESLAKKHGAYEGFTTDANMDVPDLDPSTVDQSNFGPGYVPFGQEDKAPKPAPAASRPAPAAPPTPEPVPAPAASADPTDWLAQLTEAPAEAGGLDLSSLGELQPATAEQDPTDWLNSLTASTSGIDLSGLDQLGELANLAGTPDPAAQTPADSMEWLESIARQQGGDPAEFVTPANAPLSGQPAAPASNDPGYTDYSLESLINQTTPPAEAADPASWLDDLASGKAVEPPTAGAQAVTTDEVMGALTQGKDVSPDDMAKWMSQMLEQGANRSDLYTEEDSEFDPDAPAVPSGIPDWLKEVAGPPPEAAAAPPAAAFTDEIKVPEANIPDWLKDEEPDVDDAGLENIFDSVTPAASTPAAFSTSELDRSDPWIEAFEEEYRERTSGAPAPAAPPAPSQAPTIVSPAARVTAPTFSGESDLPAETDLAMGESVEMPAWLSSVVPSVGTPPAAPVVAPAASDMPDWLREAEAAASAPTEDLPDWLKGVDVQVAPTEVPDWLRGTSQGEEEEISLMPDTPAAVIPAAPVAQAAPRPPAPAPKPVTPPAANVVAAIQSARTKVQGGDINGALVEFESVVRANGQAQVIGDLRSLVSAHRENPATYRVLGDALMRDGKLQEALDTYRKALNLL